MRNCTSEVWSFGPSGMTRKKMISPRKKKMTTPRKKGRLRWQAAQV